MSREPVRRLILLAAAVATIAACGGDSGVAPQTVVGTYSLLTYHGRSLPVAIKDSSLGHVLEITFMSPFTLTLGADGSLRIIATAKFVFQGISETSADTTNSRYTQNGSQVTFTAPDGSLAFATWNGSDMLTISDPPDPPDCAGVQEMRLPPRSSFLLRPPTRSPHA